MDILISRNGDTMPSRKKREAKAESPASQRERSVKTSLTLEYILWERAKIVAMRKGLTLAKVVEAALERYLGEGGEE